MSSINHSSWSARPPSLRAQRSNLLDVAPSPQHKIATSPKSTAPRDDELWGSLWGALGGSWSALRQAARRHACLAGLVPLFCALLLVSQTCYASVSVVDDNHITITLPTTAKRIITLAPSITELVYAVGAGKTIVGTVNTSDYPAEAKNIPRIGDHKHLDLERIATLKPDLVLVWMHGNASREVERLQALGIPMMQVEPKKLDDIPDTYRRLGKILGSEIAAQKAANAYAQRLQNLTNKYAKASKIRVFYQVWNHPLMTINGSHLISDVMTLCGGQNVFADQPMLVPQLATESVVAAQPQVMLTAGMTGDTLKQAKRDPKASDYSLWQPFSSIPAVKNGQLWLLPGSIISRHGPRILDGVEAICSVLDTVRKTQ